MKLLAEVKNNNNKPLSGIIVHLHDVTNKSPSQFKNAPILDKAVTDSTGSASLKYTRKPKIKKVALVIKNPGTVNVLVQSGSKISKNLKNKDVIKLKLPISSAPDIDLSDLDINDEVIEERKDQVLGLEKYSDQVSNRLKKKQAIRYEIKKAVAAEIKRKKPLHDRAVKKAHQILKRRTPVGSLEGDISIDGGDPNKIMVKARESGIKKMEELQSRRRGIIIRSDDKDDLHDIQDKIKNVRGAPDKVREILFSNKPPESRRAQQELLDCYVRRHMDNFKSRTEDSSKASKKTKISAVEAMTVDEYQDVDDRLNKMIQEKANNTLSHRPGAGDIEQSLIDNELANGPADTTAYYDFRSLQVAWRDVWDSVFDGEVLKDITALYEEIVEIVPDEEIEADLSDIDELADLLNRMSSAADTTEHMLEIPDYVLSWLPEIRQSWNDLHLEDLEYLTFLHYVDLRANQDHPKRNGEDNLMRFGDLFFADRDWPAEWEPTLSLKQIVESDWAKNTARAFIEKRKNARLGRVRRLITSLQKYLVEPYKFDVFAADSYNFGVVTTYRQKWKPQGFQAGELVNTIPLAPGEKRSLEIRKIEKEEAKTNDKRIDSMSDVRDMSETSRMTTKIVNKALMNLNGKAGVKFKSKVFEASTSFGFDTASESARNKEEFREAIRKSAQEYKDERTVEVSTTVTREYESTGKTEIMNPNNELTVTYLFYELQQRFSVSEKLHDVMPVVMVAFEVPKPHEIDEAWLLQHDWIIRQVLLDDKLMPAINMLSKSFAGEESSLKIKRRQWLAQLAVVEELRQGMEGSVSARDTARATVSAIMKSMNGETEDEGRGFDETIQASSIGHRLVEGLFGGDKTEQEALSNPDYDAARQALEWMESDLSNANASLRQATTALERTTESYVDAVTSSANRRIAVDQLRAHVKQNILHYMQAIWMKENADQRYMRLYDLQIEWPDYSGSVSVSLMSSTALNRGVNAPLPATKKPGTFTGLVQIPPAKLGGNKRSLYDVADIDKVIGFKGNYAVFALKEDNAITDYMMQDFLDTEFGVYDPDPDGEVLTANEALDLAHCAWQNESLSDVDKTQIKNWLIESISIANRQGQEIVVPTGELFIEALPGTHTLLEDFKLRHREADSQKAAAEARMAEIDVMRRVKLLQEGDYSDPDFDKSIRIIGDPSKVVIDSE